MRPGLTSERTQKTRSTTGGEIRAVQSRNRTGLRLDLALRDSHTLPKPRACRGSIGQTKAFF